MNHVDFNHCIILCRMVSHRSHMHAQFCMRCVRLGPDIAAHAYSLSGCNIFCMHDIMITWIVSQELKPPKNVKLLVAIALSFPAVYNRWTGTVDWTSGLDYWTHRFVSKHTERLQKHTERLSSRH